MIVEWRLLLDKRKGIKVVGVIKGRVREEMDMIKIF